MVPGSLGKLKKRSFLVSGISIAAKWGCGERMSFKNDNAAGAEYIRSAALR